VVTICTTCFNILNLLILSTEYMCICVSWLVLTTNWLFPQTALTGWSLHRRRNMFPVRYELNFYIMLLCVLTLFYYGAIAEARCRFCTCLFRAFSMQVSTIAPQTSRGLLSICGTAFDCWKSNEGFYILVRWRIRERKFRPCTKFPHVNSRTKFCRWCP
jgi:hypothetical protein